MKLRVRGGIVSKLTLTVGFVVGVLVGRLASPVAGAQFRVVKTTNLLTRDLAGWCDEKELTVELNEAGPGSSGKHYHPAHSVTWVVEGSEVYQKEGQQTRTVNAGEVLHEDPLELHTVSNSAPVKLLVVRIAEKGKPATVRAP
jgi:hypothetical protein